jgi:hypothetical protein
METSGERVAGDRFCHDLVPWTAHLGGERSAGHSDIADPQDLMPGNLAGLTCERIGDRAQELLQSVSGSKHTNECIENGVSFKPMMSIHRIYKPILTFFRRKRARAFFRINNIGPESRILDVGGDLFFWNMTSSQGLPTPREIAILNVLGTDEVLPPHIRWIHADARRMPLADQEFDVVFSNSVIEHVGDSDSQRAMASEIRRVGKSYWVQTPDPRFFIEPHYLTPLIHWIPLSHRRRFVRYGTVWGWLTRPNSEQIDEILAYIRLIGPSEFRSFFPDGRIIVERFCGWPKSLIAVRTRGDTA